MAANKNYAKASPVNLLVKLFDSEPYILPGSVGILAFDNVSRVWATIRSSNKWHNSSGGGLYYSPFNMIITSAAVGFFEKKTLFNFSTPTKFNLTF